MRGLVGWKAAFATVLAASLFIVPIALALPEWWPAASDLAAQDPVWTLGYAAASFAVGIAIPVFGRATVQLHRAAVLGIASFGIVRTIPFLFPGLLQPPSLFSVIAPMFVFTTGYTVAVLVGRAVHAVWAVPPSGFVGRSDPTRA